MTPLIPHDKKRQLTAVWLYFLFGGNSVLFYISTKMKGSASIEHLYYKSPHKKTSPIREPLAVIAKDTYLILKK